MQAATLNPWLDTLMLAMIRVSAMIASMPVISKPYVPLRIQTLLALLLTAIIAPSLPINQQFVLFSMPGILLAGQQVLLGIAMGFILKIVFEVFTLAGQFIAMQSGLGYAMVVDPQRGTQVAIIGQWFTLSASLIFILSNGHLALIQMIANSFQTMPLEQTQLNLAQLANLADFARIIFIGGVNIALPAVTALLLLNFSMAVMNRAAPQLHLFTIGFPLMLLVGLLAIYLTYASTFNQTLEEFQSAFQFMTIWLTGR